MKADASKALAESLALSLMLEANRAHALAQGNDPLYIVMGTLEVLLAAHPADDVLPLVLVHAASLVGALAQVRGSPLSSIANVVAESVRAGVIHGGSNSVSESPAKLRLVVDNGVRP